MLQWQFHLLGPLDNNYCSITGDVCELGRRKKRNTARKMDIYLTKIKPCLVKKWGMECHSQALVKRWLVSSDIEISWIYFPRARKNRIHHEVCIQAIMSHQRLVNLLMHSGTVKHTPLLTRRVTEWDGCRQGAKLCAVLVKLCFGFLLKALEPN